MIRYSSKQTIDAETMGVDIVSDTGHPSASVEVTVVPCCYSNPDGWLDIGVRELTKEAIVNVLAWHFKVDPAEIVIDLP